MEFPLPNMNLDLSGKVALVTGASSGLGRRFAEVLASVGAAVAVAGRRQDRLEELVQLIQSRGGKAVAAPLDVCDAQAISPCFDRIETELGLVDILVNNAGVPDGRYAVNMSLEEIDRVISTNFRAPFLISCEFARRLMKAERGGRIVNIASDGAFHYPPQAGATLYAATKSGVVRLTETLAMEWAKFGINVNAIAPGLFHSEMSAGFIAKAGDAALAGSQRGRIGEPAQLDSTLLYLLSPSSEFVTGICIRVDDAQKPR